MRNNDMHFLLASSVILIACFATWAITSGYYQSSPRRLHEEIARIQNEIADLEVTRDNLIATNTLLDEQIATLKAKVSQVESILNKYDTNEIGDMELRDQIRIFRKTLEELLEALPEN